MSTISFKCSACGSQLRAPLESVGKNGKCTKCGASNAIPSQDDKPKANDDALPYFAIAIAAVALLLSATTLIMSASVFDVRREMKELEAQTNKKLDRVRLDQMLSNAKLHEIDKGTVSFDPAVSTYQVITAQSQAFYLYILSAESYLNGVRMKVRIGNPSNAAFSDASLIVHWGKSSPKFEGNSELERESKKYEWKQTLKNGSFNIPRIKSGAWTETEIVLSGIEGSELGYVDFSLNLNRIQLADQLPHFGL